MLKAGQLLSNSVVGNKLHGGKQIGLRPYPLTGGPALDFLTVDDFTAKTPKKKEYVVIPYVEKQRLVPLCQITLVFVIL